MYVSLITPPKGTICGLLILSVLFFGAVPCPAVISPVVDTGQTRCYGNHSPIEFAAASVSFPGQDAQFQGNAPSYRDNGDGTITDRITGLTWSKAVDAQKMSLSRAKATAKQMTLGGHTDWRVPNIKELYSLIHFAGDTGDQRGERRPVPFINTDYFNFKYGNTQKGERYIDAQWLSSTVYVSFTMDKHPTLFGVNFADGRIKGYGYGKTRHGREKKFYVRYVRGTPYGENDFLDGTDQTVTDRATGLMWMKTDSSAPMTWQKALAYAKDSRHAGYNDWRLPNAKELQYIVDYTRSPDTTHSAAIDPVFYTAPIINEAGQKDYGFYWTSTTHLDGPGNGDNAVYISFGRAIGRMHGRIMDVHGAGAQRSDPKTGTSLLGRGPQGDARRVKNYVRLVRGGSVEKVFIPPDPDRSKYPYVVKVDKGYEADLTQGPMSGPHGFGSLRRPSGKRLFFCNPPPRRERHRFDLN